MKRPTTKLLEMPQEDPYAPQRTHFDFSIAGRTLRFESNVYEVPFKPEARPAPKTQPPPVVVMPANKKRPAPSRKNAK